MALNKVRVVGLTLVACALGITMSDTAIAGDNTILPSLATQEAIRTLPIPTEGGRPAPKPDYRELQIDRDQIPPINQEEFSFNEEGTASVPFVVPNTMILQFKPNVSASEIQKYIESRNLSVVRTFPKIGAVQVETDLSRYFQPKLTDNETNQALLRGLVEAIQDFQSDPRVRSASPDLLLRNQNHHESSDTATDNLRKPKNVIEMDTTNPTEVTDWGIVDIEADQLWNVLGGRDGVLLGVMDVGFARHEDLVFLELPPDIPVNDHGNHVAAIACGQHNGRGVRGVLPNCLVRPQSANVFFESAEGGDIGRFYVRFSQTVETLNRFVEEQDDVHAFNVSLGYNWISNFDINPDLSEASQWRILIEAQSVPVVTLLKLAEQNDKVIFSAAGNDSYKLPTPINAKYASPFNWAAMTAREQGVAQSGVIVEAHDKGGNRAGFSNTGGHISCPGVDILSAIASSPSAYGIMSGTSMASPHCAGGHLLFRLIRPGYSGVEAINCLQQSSDLSSSGTPMLRLTKAVEVCPSKKRS